MYVLFKLAKLLGPPTRKIISSTSEPKGKGNKVYTTWNAYPKIWEKCYEYSDLKRLKVYHCKNALLKYLLSVHGLVAGIPQ